MNNNTIIKKLIKEAIKAYDNGEVPVGAIIVKDGVIISKGHNLVEKNNSVISHAEINAIVKANKKLGNWRLLDCILYTSLEPCKMCKEVINKSRIKKVYYLVKGNDDDQSFSNYEHIENDYSDEYIDLLNTFFKNIRNR